MNAFIAARYLLTHMRQTLICIAGVVISVMMFITMLSMMRGFTDKFIIETVESSGHITIHDEPRETRSKILERVITVPDALLKLEGDKPRDVVRKIKNPTGLLEAIRRIPGVVNASPVVNGDAVATYGTKTYPLQLIGCDPEQQTRVTTIGTNITDGSFDRLKTTANGVVLGRGVALTLGLRLDDSITLTSSSGGLLFAKVVGIFDTGVTPVDYGRGYMLLSSAQTLLDRKNIINEIVVRTDDYNQAELIASRIEAISGYKTEGWKESNANFLKIFAVQTVITYIITGALMIVAAFGVLNILIMAVLERVNDIAILKSFGYSCADITKIYLMQGLVIAIVGASIGLVVAKLSVEGLRRLPIKMEGLVRAEGLLMSEDVAMYVTACLMVSVIVLVASVYPARRAAKYDPVDVIRGAH
jgi:lipoprotein-releasing system permease protein